MRTSTSATTWVAIAMASGIGCGDNPEIVIPPGVCNDPGGAWNPTLIDLFDPGAVGDDPELPGDCMENGSPLPIVPHHFSLSPVHAVHMPTPSKGEILIFHGRSEERVWTNGGDVSEIERYPIPFCVPWTRPARCDDGACDTANGPGDACDDNDDCAPYEVLGYPDVFCGAHQLLATGEVLVAGGNVTGSGNGGGLYEAFLFDPRLKSPTDYPYGWSRVGGDTPENMEVDRWYPTLTGLPDGRVLISGGASLDPDDRNTFEVYDPAAMPGDQITQLPDSVDFDETFGIDIPLYPFMFVLPNGDVVYAGSEEAGTDAYHARILVPDYDDLDNWHWASFTGLSSINGGSAVMYQPGRIMKSGGTLDGTIAHDGTEIIDLSGYATGSYPPILSFTRLSGDGSMVRPRHFHTLTLLPDGRVLATGGNMRGNDQRGDSPLNECEIDGQTVRDIPCFQGCPSLCRSDERCSGYGTVPCREAADCPNAATCEISDACLADPSCSGICEKTCEADADCPEIVDIDACWTTATCAPGEQTEVCTAISEARCDPGNNACFATHTAEIWDPECEEWTEYDAQQRPRMYHSVALLQRDGRVLSAGGGHERGGLVDQTNAEHFQPTYGNGPMPMVTVVDDFIDNDEDYTVHVPYAPGEIEIQLENPAAQAFSRVTLVRLGSVTHQFDMGQRFVELPVVRGEGSSGPLLTLTGPPTLAGNPFASGIAPPGYYMLFVWSDTGTPSMGQYVHLGGPEMAQMWSCAPSPSFEVIETSCRLEPVRGACPAGASVETRVALPQAEGMIETIEGWNVHAPHGLVRDAAAPTDVELAAIEGMCVAACEAEWADEPAIAASCRDAGAFEMPEAVAEDSSSSLDLVIASQQDGSGVFGEQRLTCRLGADCCNEFDEALCSTAPDRTTPADAPLGRGEEYRVALGAASRVEVITNHGTFASPVTGSIGYSFCTQGSTSAPCPFYVGSFEARAVEPIEATMRCADGTTAEHTIDEIVTRLAQPAFGIAEQGAGATRKGFPPGALQFDSEIEVDGQSFGKRRPNHANVVMTASGASFSAANLGVELTVPCNESTASVTVRYTVRDPGDGQALAKPPAVTIGVPANVRCGATTSLAATASDPNDDLDSVRWYVDDVLMSPTTSSMVFTRSHELRAVARDRRGGTTTATKTVRCT